MSARVKNPYFWIGLVGVVLTAMGVSPEMFTSWSMVLQSGKELLGNPYMLCCVVCAVIGVMVNPASPGLTD